MKRHLLAILMAFVVFSCIEFPIGKWSDNIHLSIKNASLTAAKDSVTITTKGDSWWIDGITFQDSIFSYYHREDIDIHAANFFIREACFTLERRNKKTLVVTLLENNTGIERNMHIAFQAGNYFDYVNIRQVAN